jgi:hypothetical protein
MSAEWSPSTTDAERLDALTREIAERADEMRDIFMRCGVPVGKEAKFSLDREGNRDAGLIARDVHVLVPKWCDDSGCWCWRGKVVAC